jgi:hypothetical protein
MRHYDRAGYRHLDDADRYRDHEYRADDGWIGPNEHGNWATSENRQPTPDERPPHSAGPSRRQQGHQGPERGRAGRRLSGASAWVDALLRPRQALHRFVRRLLRIKGPQRSELD